ncbi:MAG: hypothetical protein L6R40_003800 [Gallowayella cf. fulva]|nr:MAG: hypothetical protein L6R40_003800 [Xanthomendoza cf. fulva]
MALLPIIFFLCHCLISCYLLWGHFHYLTLSIFPSTSSTIPQADGGQATRLLPPQLSQTKTTAKCTFTPSSTLDTMPGPTYSQHALTLPSYPRGSHLITSDITSQLSAPLKGVKVGLLHLFLQHTSCAMSLNENYDSDVRKDMTDSLDKIVVEDKAGKGIYRHDAEGSDDMPAHIKSSLIGASVSIPITDGKLALGTWQGIWFLEFRDGKHRRKVLATIQGERT